jgi:hypothetical protein
MLWFVVSSVGWELLIASRCHLGVKIAGCSENGDCEDRAENSKRLCSVFHVWLLLMPVGDRKRRGNERADAVSLVGIELGMIQMPALIPTPQFSVKYQVSPTSSEANNVNRLPS